jgi:hypothetical protein
MKTIKNKTEDIGFVGYSDAPEDIDKAINTARRVKDILPYPEKLQYFFTHEFFPAIQFPGLEYRYTSHN